MQTSLPSLDVLKTFVVVAERLNFTHAAQTLHLTQGAVSRQILGLEQQLGYPLFSRRARGLTLTPQGAQLLAPVQLALEQLAQALAKAGEQPGTLRVKCPTCAMRWVLPRIIRLQNERPEMHIELTASVSHGLDFGSEHFDAAVVFGKPQGKRLVVHHLFDEILTPVCTPNYLPDLAQPVEPADLAETTLLHPTRDRRDWLLWLGAYGYAGLPSAKAQHFDTLDLAISSAMQGLGVTIGDVSLIEDDLRAKRVIAPFPLRVASGAAYYLVYPERPAPSQALQNFVHWLDGEARITRQTICAHH